MNITLKTAEIDRRTAEGRLVCVHVAGVLRVWPSEANFLLVETSPESRIVEKARRGGILLRDFGWDPLLPGCVRITVGTPAENDLLMQALRA